MLNTVYRLVSPKQIEAVAVDEEVRPDSVIVRPTHLSVCHADQRYYQGLRDATVLRQKLPMALIHEGIGVVERDYTGTFTVGERVVIVPNTPFESSTTIDENYLPSSRFRSSGYDGLMQEYVFTTPDRLVPVLEGIDSAVAAYTEMISVSFQAIARLERVMDDDRRVFGIWGDGNLGYITANLVRELYPDSTLLVFGKVAEKLSMFSFADGVFSVDAIPSGVRISQAFECVGGVGSQYAIDQIIDRLQPEGSLAIMGVSEHPVQVNTRLVLEKGLSISGSSRSGAVDFQRTAQFLADYPVARRRFENLVGLQATIRSVADIHRFFEADMNSSWGKSVMRWEV